MAETDKQILPSIFIKCAAEMSPDLTSHLLHFLCQHNSNLTHFLWKEFSHRDKDQVTLSYRRQVGSKIRAVHLSQD